MRILITGGKGFIGSHLIDALLKQDHSLTTFDSSTRPIAYNNWKKVNQVQGKIEDTKLLDATIARHDFVFHLAGILGTSETLNNVYETVESNIIGTLHILDSLKKHKKKGLNITIGGIDWLNPYAITKLAAEKFTLMYAKEFDTDIKVVRGLNTYGPRQKHSPVRKAIPNFIINALQNKPLEIYGDGNQIVDLVFVDDLVKILVLAMNYKDKLLHVIDAGTGVKTRVNEAAKTIIRLTKSKSKLIHLPMRKGEPENSVTLADVTTLKEFNYIPSTSFEEGLKKTIPWYKKLLENNAI